MAANHYLFAKSSDKPVAVPTSYQEVTPIVTEEAVPLSAKSQNKKVDYKIIENKVMPSTNENAMTAEAAAKIGAEYLQDMFQADLDGKIIQMSFSVDPSRAIAYWYGDVFNNESELKEIVPEPLYAFGIEAISGERTLAQGNWRMDDKKETVKYKESDAQKKYKDDCEEFLKLAKTFAEKQLPSTPVKAEYSGISSILAEGFTFKKPKNQMASVTVDGVEYKQPDLIEVSQDDEYEAACVFITILVTDDKGNQVNVDIDVTSKKLMTINSIYSGINYDPGSVG